MLAGGAAGQFPLEQWFYEMPVCTRWWTTATVVTSVLVQCQVITPFQLFYSTRAVFIKNQVCTHPADLFALQAVVKELTVLTYSTGASSQHSSTSVRCPSTSSSMSSSSSAIPVCLKSRLAVPRHISHGFLSTRQAFCWCSRRCCPYHSLGLH